MAVNTDSDIPADTASNLPQAKEIGLSFRLENHDDLWVEFVPTDTARELTQDQLRQLIDTNGYPAEDFPLFPESLAVLTDALRRREHVDLCISKPTDARVEIFLSKDKYLAGAVLHPSKGRGRTLDHEQLYENLKRMKVVRGVLEDVVQTLTSQELADQLHNSTDTYCTVIAYGEVLQNGKDAHLEILVPRASDRRPQMDERGDINYLEQGDFPYVEANTPIARIHPATKGKSGWTVTGKAVRARDGKELKFDLKDGSVKPAEADPNLLIATLAGLPVITDRGAQIEEVLKLEHVDLTTGHVRFKGSIEIRGDVRDKMEILATGDVRIGGVVDAAIIRAGGHIEVVGGVIGHKNTDEGKAYLKSECGIKVRFVHEAVLHARQDIIVSNQAMHSQLTAGEKILIQGKGQVVGGSLKATDRIEANTTGAVAYVETRLEVGECQQLQDQYTHLLDQLNHLDEQKYQLIEIARKIRSKGAEELRKKKPALLKAKEQIQKRTQHINEQISGVEEALKRFYAARIVIHRKVFPGTLIRLAGHTREITRELDHATFYLENDQLQLHQ